MQTFKKLKQYYWPYKKFFIISTFFLFVVTAITVVYPIVLQLTIDNVVLNQQYDWIVPLTLAFFGIMLIKAIATFFQQYMGDLFGISSVYRLRNVLYEKLQFLPFRYYDNAKTGDLMSRLTADVESFRFFLSFGFAEIIRLVLLLIVTFGVMFYYSVPLTLATMVSLPFLCIVVYKFDRAVHPAFRNIRRSFGRLNTNVQESISGINTVKSLSREEFQNQKFNVSNEDYKDRNIFISNIWAKFFPLMEFLGDFCVIALLSLGGYFVIKGSLQPGELVAFYSLVGFILWPIMNLGFTINQFSQSKASGERLLEILEAQEDITDKEDAYSPERLEGRVEFRNVSLRYAGEDISSLKDINFAVEPGQIIGLVGATGSGKTSITQLITRFYDVESGEVLVDGKNVKDYSLNALRSNIGFVLQESFLFSSSIKANIAYGRPDASMEDIIDAAKRADAHEFITQMPNGYDTVLGERGLGLSGGQKQRIAIARAICLDPSILILDDATSAVDMETEFKIQGAMREVMKGRTTFIIAHRISSLKHADEILVLENGRIVERGTHEQLIHGNGLYERVYKIQFQDQKAILQGQRG
ncbi:ABC transporter ATP-binding protein/permease [Lederbergia sp. NSJ-179]|uniref:ABC transporter ATP-binding protein n=1 Tax=Lederbergia sp. NSJ-179 TaxID=2931402 RepID=UPI001FCFA0AA|nr:ABC transporter ATP-binding protein [Lederbergia sp. NSJ-179]MCJ7841693.1 ABC transporter ATP-binding protein/permease [Lederbergia sp. NSJ-179]